MSGADMHFGHNILVAKMCTRLKKIMRFKNGKPVWDLEKLRSKTDEKTI
jgi:hypothetical protein